LLPAFTQDREVGIDGDPGKTKLEMMGQVCGIANEDAYRYARLL
jgi:hypothetical protein